MSLRTGCSLSLERRKALHEKIGKELSADVYEQHLTGHRVLVAPTPVDERTAGGIIIKPRSAVERQQLRGGSGWIISVGPLAGMDDGYSPGALSDKPEDLLGRYVTFKAHSGTALRVSEQDASSDWEGDVYVLTDKEIMTVSPEQQV